ncbi:GNAT family N-acetyltransferase [Candidatus Altiarchaeota archaeon]
MKKEVMIRRVTEEGLEDILKVEKAAFKEEAEVIVKLVKDLLEDTSAQPILSLLALDEDKPAGHILFTSVHLECHDDVDAMLLAPLAVAPEMQKQGVGGLLILEGLRILKERGVELVFVLGYPDYYTRHGFAPAFPHGYTAPYPIPEENHDAWMIQELSPGAVKRYEGKIICAEKLDKPKYWRE